MSQQDEPPAHDPRFRDEKGGIRILSTPRRRYTKWHWLGYAATLAWIVYAVNASGGDLNHPMADTIFTVPLVGWAVGLGVAFWWRRRRRAADPDGS